MSTSHGEGGEINWLAWKVSRVKDGKPLLTARSQVLSSRSRSSGRACCAHLGGAVSSGDAQSFSAVSITAVLKR